MKAIIWDQSQSTSEVLKIEPLEEEMVFHLANGQVLRVGESPQKLQAQLNRIKEIPGIDLSKVPSTQPDIFYAPFMLRSVYEMAWPIVRTDPKVEKAFQGHPRLQAVTQLSYDELQELPLNAYVSGPFGLYLGHPFNFVNSAPDPTLADGNNEYRCDFREGDYLVKVFVNMRTQAVTITK